MIVFFAVVRFLGIMNTTERKSLIIQKFIGLSILFPIKRIERRILIFIAGNDFDRTIEFNRPGQCCVYVEPVMAKSISPALLRRCIPTRQRAALYFVLLASQTRRAYTHRSDYSKAGITFSVRSIHPTCPP
jgi:hypothetical protein